MITWSRLLAGQYRDPLVGRDLLVGCVFGAARAAVIWLSQLAGRLVGAVDPAPSMPMLDPLLGSRYMVSAFLGVLYSAIFSALGLFMLFFLARLVFRREWIAAAVFVAALLVTSVSFSENPLLSGLFSLVSITLAVVLLLRFGLAAYVVGNFVVIVLGVAYPMTADLSKWYGAGSITALVVLSALAIYGFRVSLGGRPLSSPGNTTS